MSTYSKIEEVTHICTMSLDNSNQIAAYYAEVMHWGDMVEAGLITIEEAIELVRKA